MATDALTFGPHASLPLTSSSLFDRPYLYLRKYHSKNQKPNFSKLSILTKSSIGSSKQKKERAKNPQPSSKTVLKKNAKKAQKNKKNERS